MKKRKYLLTGLGVAAFCALAILLALVWKTNRPSAEAGKKQVTVEVVHSDGAQVEFTYETDLEYLGELLKEEGLISGTESEYGLFVDTVDGETADYSLNGSWWRLSCNGTDAETGVDGVVLRDGDTYTWTYTVG